MAQTTIVIALKFYEKNWLFKLKSHLYEIAKLGHFDTITIGDCGLPVPDGVQRID